MNITHQVAVGCICFVTVVVMESATREVPRTNSRTVVDSARTISVQKPKRDEEFQRPAQRIAETSTGPCRQQAVRVAKVDEDESVQVEVVDRGDVERDSDEASQDSMSFKVKVPLEMRLAQLVDYSFYEPGEDGSEDGLPPGVRLGDVYLSGLPMIDQERKPYCLPASAARVLQNYGIDITMEDMVYLAGSSETGGTDSQIGLDALGQVANAYGLELKTVEALTDRKHKLQQLLDDYNQTARDMGYDELYSEDYVNAFVHDYRQFDYDREYYVQREVMLSNERTCDAFEKNVIERIDKSDPILWEVRLGDVPEKGVKLGKYDARHMRIIVGYNVERHEVLYSDSWGDEHVLKRMNAQDALSITRGMFYLSDD